MSNLPDGCTQADLDRAYEGSRAPESGFDLPDPHTCSICATTLVGPGELVCEDCMAEVVEANEDYDRVSMVAEAIETVIWTGAGVALALTVALALWLGLDNLLALWR